MTKTKSPQIRRIALLTGGGDAPGLNGVIESIVRSAKTSQIEVLGILDGFEGVFEKRTLLLTENEIWGQHTRAGTLLGTSNKSFIQGREKEFVANLKSFGVEGLVAAGGDGTFASLSRIANEVPLLGVPKTIDNDLAGTDVTFGYDTACGVVADSIDALRATAEAHRRVIVVETMGRTTGWIVLGGGLASYADAILMPERPFSRAKLKSFLLEKKNAGRRGLVLAVAEGAAAENETVQVAFRVEGSPQKDRYGGVAQALSRWIEEVVGWESRHVVLGHLQRSSPPTTTDRFLTLTMGVEITRMLQQKIWQQAVVYRNGIVTRAPIQDLMQAARLVPREHHWIENARMLDIFV